MNEIKTLHEKLIDIQQRLVVKKLRENDFGGFNYRNVEDTEAAVKPFLKEHSLILLFDDEIIELGGRVYVKSTATLSDGKDTIAVSAHAREAEKPKAKTDDAQLTGGCSSYARKYAANGLFLIDDGSEDPDNNKKENANAAGLIALSTAKAKLYKALKDAGYDDSVLMVNQIEKAIGKQAPETVVEVNRVIESLGKDNEPKA